MRLAAFEDFADLGTLTAVIARSPIIVAEPAAPVWSLPDGFDRADAIILAWIAGEGRRLNRRVAWT